MTDAYDLHPTVMWELTRACDLHCRACPVGASAGPGANELTTYESYKTIDQIAELRPRELLITGGDPLERDDVYQVIDYARRRGLDPALVVSPTARVTQESLANLQRNGLTTIVFRVDDAVTGDLTMLRWAELIGFRIEINTLIWRRTMNELEAIADRIRPFGIARWNLHFVVPVGGSREIEMITSAEAEQVFTEIDAIREREEFAIRVIEAPHYRRFRLERSFGSYLEGARELLDSARDGARSFVYISHAGDVRASEFAPHSAGNLRYRPLGAIYRASDLFVALRDPDNLKGRCRRCEYRHVCGGSRARAWAMTGDLFGSDPLCAFGA